MLRPRLFRASVLLLVVAAAVLTFACSRKGKPNGPDVILIVIDTSRGDRFGMNGYARPTSPHLDELAKTSVTFTDAWAPAPHTGPSHATLFTGLRPEHHGLTETPSGNMFLGPAHDTVAEILQRAGWRTEAWSNNQTVSAQFGLEQGFETFHRMWEDRTTIYPWARKAHAELLAWAKERTASSDHFFGFVNDMEPHAPYTPTAESQARFVDPKTPAAEVALARDYMYPLTFGWMLGRHEIAPERFRLLSDLYDAEIADVDAALGELVDGLRASGRLDETLLIVCGDHGESFGENGIAEHGVGVYRSLLHVPLLVRLPGKFDGGRRVTDTVRLEDVLPTILETCGIAVPAGLDGASLAKPTQGRVALGGFGPNPRLQAQLELNFPGADTALVRARWRSVHDGRWHLVTRSDGNSELFDVSADPGETKDLAAAEAAVVARLSALLPK